MTAAAKPVRGQIVELQYLRALAVLLVVIGQYGAKGVIMLNFDLKPDFPDTPRNWEWEIENAFTWGGR